MTDLVRNPPMMGCGHTANSTRDGKPSCVMCTGLNPEADVVIEIPDVTGRMARCSCGKLVPSDPSRLAFFQSAEIRARQTCKVCRYAAIAHAEETRQRPHNRNTKLGDGHAFVRSDADEFDSYYCGCRGFN